MKNNDKTMEIEECEGNEEVYFDWDLFEEESGFHCWADIAADYCGC